MELENAVSAGVSLNSMGSDLVPLYEEHEARLERGIRLEEWGAMPVFEKALVIASRRIRIAIDNLQADAEIKKAKQDAARISPRGKR